MEKYWKLVVGFFVLIVIMSAAMVQISLSTEEITSNEDFFTLQIGDIPNINGDTWVMPIDGVVNSPTTINYTYLTSLPKQEVLETLNCVDGPSDTAVWGGILLETLIEPLDINDSAREIVFYGADGYSSSLSLEEAFGENVILAYEMNGETLPKEHGFPVRLVVPDNYGYKWVKWITHIEVVDYDYQGYWESKGWSDDASIKPFNYWAVHAVLLSFAAVFGGLSAISGLKFSKHTTFWRKLPDSIDQDFHKSSYFLYFMILYPTFIYWAFTTYQTRGSIFYSNHGLLALATLSLHTVGLITGASMLKRPEKLRTAHLASNMLGYLLLLGTILTGLIKAF